MPDFAQSLAENMRKDSEEHLFSLETNYLENIPNTLIK